jgi:hypothetical protein
MYRISECVIWLIIIKLILTLLIGTSEDIDITLLDMAVRHKSMMS